jgi:hypothetical protein
MQRPVFRAIVETNDGMYLEEFTTLKAATDYCQSPERVGTGPLSLKIVEVNYPPANQNDAATNAYIRACCMEFIDELVR